MGLCILTSFWLLHTPKNGQSTFLVFLRLFWSFQPLHTNGFVLNKLYLELKLLVDSQALITLDQNHYKSSDKVGSAQAWGIFVMEGFKLRV